MSIYGVFTYSQTKNKLQNQLSEEVYTSAEQLKDSIRPYIESFAPDEYDNLLVNEMSHSNILAIVVEDYRMGNILGKKSYVSGKIRNNLWNVIDFNVKNEEHQDLLKNSTISYSAEILAKVSDEKIGLISVYSSDQLIEKELNQIISKNIMVTIIIYVLLIWGIYYGINLFLLDPLKEVIENIQMSDSDGIPLHKLTESGSKEIVLLERSINKMIDTVKDSRLKLQEQKEEFEMIFNNTKDGIAILDLESNFLQCNQGYLEITNFTKEELLSRSCIELTLAEDKEKAKKALQKVIEEKQVSNLEKQCLIKDDEVITVNMSMSLLPDQKRILATIKDVTKLKVLESQAKLASMGEMIGNIAHQWRQPLSIISTSASGAKIQRELGDLTDEEFDRYMDSIVYQTEYLSKTIDDFKNFIKEGSKRAKPLQIVSAIEKTLTLVESSFKNNYIELITSFEADLEIIGHENELIQAFINIFNNAKDAIKANLNDDTDKLIFIETKSIDNGLEILIKDNAGGIDPSIKNRIFEPYFTTKHQSVGTGIGLSLARSIITEHHNATIDFCNEEYTYKEKTYIGACFKITFYQ